MAERSDGRIRLGARLFELGQRVPSRRVLRDAALPFLEDVHLATGETVHLAVLDAPEVLYVEKVVGHDTAPTPSVVAGRHPAGCTATGKALLAWSSPEVVAATLAAGLPPRTPHTITSPQLLVRQLAEIRVRGWASELEELRLGFASVAAPILDPEGQPVGAISVTTASGRADVERLAAAVVPAARGLSRQLGRSAQRTTTLDARP